MRKILYNTKAADPDPVRPVIPSVAKVFGVMGLTLCFSVASIAPAYAQNNPGTVAPTPAAAPPPTNSWFSSVPRFHTRSLLKALVKGVMAYTALRMIGAVGGVDGNPYFRNAIPDQTLYLGDNLNINFPSDMIGNLTSDYSLTVALEDGSPLPSLLEDAIIDAALIGNAPVASSASSASAQDDRAYVIEGNGIRIFNVGNISNPQQFGFYNFSDPTAVIDATVQDHIAYILDNDGLSSVDISDPGNPKNLGNVTAPGISFAVHDNTALIAGGDTLRAINITDPANMQILSSVATNIVTQTSLFGPRAFTYSSSGFEMFNISDPSNITALGMKSLAGLGQLAAVNDQLQVTQAFGSSLSILNIENPNNISTLGTYNPPNLTNINDLVIGDQSGTTYLAGANGVEILQTSDPQNITLAGFVSASDTATAFAVMGNTAITITSGNLLQTINLGRLLTGTPQLGVYVIRLNLEDSLGNILATSTFTITVATLSPTAVPSMNPSQYPSLNPSLGPTGQPSSMPVALPTAPPSALVTTLSPTTLSPTSQSPTSQSPTSRAPTPSPILSIMNTSTSTTDDPGHEVTETKPPTSTMESTDSPSSDPSVPIVPIIIAAAGVYVITLIIASIYGSVRLYKKRKARQAAINSNGQNIQLQQAVLRSPAPNFNNVTPSGLNNAIEPLPDGDEDVDNINDVRLQHGPAKRTSGANDGNLDNIGENNSSSAINENDEKMLGAINDLLTPDLHDNSAKNRLEGDLAPNIEKKVKTPDDNEGLNLANDEFIINDENDEEQKTDGGTKSGNINDPNEEDDDEIDDDDDDDDDDEEDEEGDDDDPLPKKTDGFFKIE